MGPTAKAQVSTKAVLSHVCTVHWRRFHIAHLPLPLTELFKTLIGLVGTNWTTTVWQLWDSHPQEFEFEASLLIFLLDSVYSARFGSFLVDKQRERLKGWQTLLPHQTIHFLLVGPTVLSTHARFAAAVFQHNLRVVPHQAVLPEFFEPTLPARQHDNTLVPSAWASEVVVR